MYLNSGHCELLASLNLIHLQPHCQGAPLHRSSHPPIAAAILLSSATFIAIKDFAFSFRTQHGSRGDPALL